MALLVLKHLHLLSIPDGDLAAVRKDFGHFDYAVGFAAGVALSRPCGGSRVDHVADQRGHLSG